jgi:hypothetical protein
LEKSLVVSLQNAGVFDEGLKGLIQNGASIAASSQLGYEVTNNLMQGVSENNAEHTIRAIAVAMTDTFALSEEGFQKRAEFLSKVQAELFSSQS